MQRGPSMSPSALSTRTSAPPVLQRHFKRRCVDARHPSTYSALASAENLLTVLAEEYLSVRDATVLSMASFAVSDTIYRCAVRNTLAFELQPVPLTDADGSDWNPEYPLVVTRILSAAKTFASVLNLEIFGGCSSSSHFDMPSLGSIERWCAYAHCQSKRGFAREANMGFARSFFRSLRSIVIRDIRVSFDDRTLGLILHLADPEVPCARKESGNRAAAPADGPRLEELVLEHCPSICLNIGLFATANDHIPASDTSDGSSMSSTLVISFPSSLKKISLDGCGVNSLSVIKELMVDRCPRLSNLSILRTPAFVKWMESGVLKASLNHWHNLTMLRTCLRQGEERLLEEMLDDHSHALFLFQHSLGVMKIQQKEMSALLEHLHAHLMRISAPKSSSEIEAVLHREMSTCDITKSMVTQGVSILRRVYCAITSCVLVRRWRGVLGERIDDSSIDLPLAPTSLVVTSLIDSGKFIEFLSQVGFFKVAREVPSAAGADSRRELKIKQTLAHYFQRQRSSLWGAGNGSSPFALPGNAEDFTTFPVPECSLRLNELILARLARVAHSQRRIDPTSSPLTVGNIYLRMGRASVMNMAMLAEGGGGAVAEHQLLLSTAAVFDGCQTSKLKDLLDLSGSFPNGRWGDANWFTPLMGAAQAGNPSKISLLLQRGWDPRSECHNGSTAMHFAIASTSKYAARTVRVLAKSLGPEYIRTYRERESGFTLLHRAALEAETLSVFKAIVGLKGIDSVVNVRCRKRGHTALQFACVESSDACVRVRLLLAAGAEVNMRDTVHGDTALLFSCRHYDRLNRNAGVLRVLLDYGADRDIRSGSSENGGADAEGEGATAIDYIRGTYRGFNLLQKSSHGDPAFLDAVRKRAMRLLTEYESPAMAAARRRLGVSPRRQRSRRSAVK